MNKEFAIKNKDVARMFATSVVALGLFAVVASVGASFTDTSAPAPQINKGGPIHEGYEYNVFCVIAGTPCPDLSKEGQYKLGGLSVGLGTDLLPGELLGAEHPSGVPSLVVTAERLRTGDNGVGKLTAIDTYFNGNVTIGSASRVVQTSSGNILVPEYPADLRVLGLLGSTDSENYNATFSELKHCASTPQPVCVNDAGKIYLCNGQVVQCAVDGGTE